jgi:hypothetical protein
MSINNDRDHKEMKVDINHALTGTKRGKSYTKILTSYFTDAEQIECLWKELTKLRDGGPTTGPDDNKDKGESLAKMVHRLKDQMD